MHILFLSVFVMNYKAALLHYIQLGIQIFREGRKFATHKQRLIHRFQSIKLFIRPEEREIFLH